jgi:Putative beta-lactamase-inhibitor-like, PepSY-like
MRTFLLLVVLGRSIAVDVEDLPVKKLPAAVVRTIRERYPKAMFAEATRDTATAKYEVTLKSDGRVYDVTVAVGGALERIDKEVTAAELPKAVKAALDMAYPNATTKSLLEVTRIVDGKDVDDGYRAYLDVPGDRPILVRIERDGKLTKE